MTITRRNVLLGATATAALLPLAALAQTSEVVIGVIYPLSGASAQIGVDAQKAFETAADIINKNYDFDLPLAKGEGLPGLGGAKIRLVFADHHFGSLGEGRQWQQRGGGGGSKQYVAACDGHREVLCLSAAIDVTVEDDGKPQRAARAAC